MEYISNQPKFPTLSIPPPTFWAPKVSFYMLRDNVPSWTFANGYLFFYTPLYGKSTKEQRIKSMETTISPTHLILRNISPVCKILKNWLSVVASWKYAFFSLTKKVSGTQMSFMYSAPTTNFSSPIRRSKDNRGSCQNWRKYMSSVKSCKWCTTLCVLYKVYWNVFWQFTWFGNSSWWH